MEIGDWEVEIVSETILMMDKIDTVDPVTNERVEYNFYHTPTKITIPKVITYIKRLDTAAKLEFLTDFVAKLKISHIDTLDRRLPGEVRNGHN